MKRTLAKSWVAALRSGKFKQTKVVLRNVSDKDNPRHCCLGVLLEVCTRHKTLQEHHENMEIALINGFLLGDNLLEVVGLSEEDQTFLTSHNDGHFNHATGKRAQKWSFNKIATWIEKKFVTLAKTKSK